MPDAAVRVDAAVDSSVTPPDLGTTDAFVCMPDPPPDTARETDDGCTIPFSDMDCDGVIEFDPICPVCPHAPSEEVDGTPCDVPGFACEYSGAGFCNFWGCDCGDVDGDGTLEWACWWPLC